MIAKVTDLTYAQYLTSRSNVVLFSFVAPSTADRAAIEPPFLWILSFGGAKESFSPSGAITRLTHRRDSDFIMFFLYR